MADPDQTPESLKRLVERRRDKIDLHAVADRKWVDQAITAISALTAERDALAGENAGLKAVFEAGLQVQDQYRTRAEQAEAKLREINVLAREARTVEGISIALALQTIETLSRSTSQGGEG